MYNVLKNKIYPYFFNTFAKDSYKLISENDTEAVYYRKYTNSKSAKLVVIVKDDEIGARIYSVVKSLKEVYEPISTETMSFKITKYFVDKVFRVKLFCVDLEFSTEKEWNDFSKVEKLEEIVTFIISMQKNCYHLLEERFNNNLATSVSGFLSFFKFTGVEENEFCGAIIKYIHFVLSDGKDFESFYEKIVSENLIYKISDFPYCLPVIKMCYGYFVLGTIPNNILNILQRERIEENSYSNLYYRDYYIVVNKDLDSTLRVIKKTDEYTNYEGNFKIFHNLSSDFENFLRSGLNTVNLRELSEVTTTFIIDFSGNIVGYKYETFEDIFELSDIEKNLNNPREILNFVYMVSSYILKVRSCLDSNTGIYQNDFEIKHDLVFLEKYQKIFKIRSAKELFYLSTCSESSIKDKILKLFFELYKKYLENCYGKMSSSDELWEKMEVRYLAPIIAQNFINYILGESVNYTETQSEFYKFLNSAKRFYGTNFFYDSRFEYNPLETPYMFDYEVEKKYGISLKKGLEESLPDGKQIVIFKRKKDISVFNRKEMEIRKDISSKVGNIESPKIKFVGISEIIYSKSLNSNNMYSMVGYILNPIEGTKVTSDVLLSFNNKEMLRFMGNLIAAFSNNRYNDYYIDWENFWMDDNFNFYVDIFDENIHFERKRESNFLNWFANYMIYKGYNPNAFVGLDFQNVRYNGARLVEIARSYDAFCDEHKIYYNSSDKMCPVCLQAKAVIPNNFVAKHNRIFEDEYAIHYRFNHEYNIKIYKKSMEDLSEIEKSIDNFVALRLLGSLPDFQQDCFIPYKKAVDENRVFIGYTYKAVSFDSNNAYSENCIDLTDTKNLKNLPRLMGLIRLISQIQSMIKSGFKFTRNPLTHVFLNKDHKKQVQILNIEFMARDSDAYDTKEWTYEYVYNVLGMDPTIEDSILCGVPMTLEEIYDKLNILAKEMTKYCPIHNIYYRNSNLFCPKCIDRKSLGHIETVEINPSDFSEHENEGGESFIYPYGFNEVAKVFKADQIDYNFKNLIIAAILRKRSILNDSNSQNRKYKFVTIKKILIDKNTHNICGYTMDRVKGVALSSLRDKKVVEDLGITRKDVFEILITVGEGIEFLHEKANIYIGDLNGRNILFDTEKNVYFLDFDGMGIDDIAPVFCTDGYIDPISKKNQNITKKDDWYSFAIQAFYYLTFTHPFNGIYYVKKNGQRVMLDTIDKMEQRISLLGNHGIELPDVAIPWDWMNRSLHNAFMEIFEKDSRENITPYLKKQYKILYEVGIPEETSIRINAKFVASEAELFEGNVSRVINSISAVCATPDSRYLAVLANNKLQKKQYNLYHIDPYNEIIDVLVLENGIIVWVIYETKIIAVNLEEMIVIYTEYVENVKDAVVNQNTLYFTTKSDIFQRVYHSNEDIRKDTIRFMSEKETKCFYAQFNSKFILVKQKGNGVDEIYCNSLKFCDINYTSPNPKYAIMYDDATKLWLIVNSDGNGIIIHSSSGRYEEFSIPKEIDDMEVKNITFNKGNVYIPSSGCLYIINVKDQTNFKKFECQSIMTPNSKIYNVNNAGFSFHTENAFYDVRKG